MAKPGHNKSPHPGVLVSRNRKGTEGSSVKEAAGKPGPEMYGEENGNGNGNGNGRVRYRSLVINGTKYRTRLNRKFDKRKFWQNPDPRKISSGIPGTVIKIYVAEGQEVKEGEQMLILEAMKMKNRIVFHTGGTVRAIHVKEGEKIPKDHLMLELV